MRIGPYAGTAALGGAALVLLARRRQDQAAAGELRGQVAAITGGSRGLGLLLARELAARGCRIALCARDQNELDRARAALEGQVPGAEILTVVADVANREEAAGFVDAVTRRYGRVDLLVNNAGIIQVGPLRSLGAAEFEDAMGVMFFGQLYPTLAVLPQMRARGGGRIVNITSIGGKVSVPHLLPYNAAKFAAVGFSEGLHAEVARDGISVTTVVPGLMRTGSHLNALFTGDQEAEFTWFSLGASLPLLSIDAERAAKRIVNAAVRRQPELILTPQAHLAARLQALFPAAMARAFSLADRLLPAAPEAPDRARPGILRGLDVMRGRRSPALERMTALGLRAAERFHQFPTTAGQRPTPNGAST
jgi:short-subunit dehydrogenase